MSKSVKKQNSEISSALSEHFAKDAGKGLEGIGKDDLAIPFIKILQALSPECDKNKPEFIEEARPGMIFNTVSRELSLEITVIPCGYEKQYLEWKPRENGGGLVGVHTGPNAIKLLSTCERDHKNKDILPNGNNLVTTAIHYVALVKDNGLEFVAIPMSSTALKKSRRWNSVMAGIQMKDNNGTIFTPPVFSHMYKLEPIGETNSSGSWFNWSIELLQIVQDGTMYLKCKKFSEDMSEGKIKVQYEQPSDEEVPF